MKKSFLIKAFILAAFFCTAPSAFSFGGFAFSLGSGYVFYGDEETKNLNDALDTSAQIIVNTTAAYHFKLAAPVYLALTAESVADFRWGGGAHVYHLDYAGLLGFEIYPGIAGLLFTIDYALGRRTTFFDLSEDEADFHNTHWGNGFKIGVLYDFGYNNTFLSPMIGASWRRMPRGGGADNILSVFFKLTLK